MSEKSNLNSSRDKYEKLTGFANWPIWSMIIKFMLIKKDMWDLTEIRPCPIQENPII